MYDVRFQVWIYLLFILIEWLIPDEEKSLVDLDTQTKFILDRKRIELRENRLIEAQILNQLERHNQDRELQNDGSRTTRSTLTQSSMNSKSSWTRVVNLLPGRASQYNSRRSSNATMLPSRISNIGTILAQRPVQFTMPPIHDDSEISNYSRSSDELRSLNSQPQKSNTANTSQTYSFTQE